jgi:hypothetical protein
MIRMVLILEDDHERIERFAAVLQSLSPATPYRVWQDAHSMIREAGTLLPDSAFISLDHDLISLPGSPDPGEGYMVVQWLTAQTVVRPVIVHSSNSESCGERHLSVARLSESSCYSPLMTTPKSPG